MGTEFHGRGFTTHPVAMLDRTRSELFSRPILDEVGPGEKVMVRALSEPCVDSSFPQLIPSKNGLSKEFHVTDEDSPLIQDVHIVGKFHDGLSKEFHGIDGSAFNEDGHISEQNDIESEVCVGSSLPHRIFDEVKEFHGTDEVSAVIEDGGNCEEFHIDNGHVDQEYSALIEDHYHHIDIEHGHISEEESCDDSHHIEDGDDGSNHIEGGQMGNGHISTEFHGTGFTTHPGIASTANSNSRPAPAKLVRLKSSLGSAFHHHNIEDARSVRISITAPPQSAAAAKLVRLRSSLDSAFRQRDINSTTVA